MGGVLIVNTPEPRVDPVITFDEELPQALALVAVDRIQQRLIEWPRMTFEVEAVVRSILRGIYQGHPKQYLLAFEVFPRVQKMLQARDLYPHPRLV